jgi:hypothetical protein
MMQHLDEKLRSNAIEVRLQARNKFLLAFLLITLTFGCRAQKQIPVPETITPATSEYKTEIFNLVDPDGDRYQTTVGKNVSRAFDEILGLSGLDVKMLRKRLMSGPATEGSLWKIGASSEWLYQICQANQCNVTNVALLYNEQTHRAAARLLYRCTQKWLGSPSDAEKALIDNQYPAKIDADDARICCWKK